MFLYYWRHLLGILVFYLCYIHVFLSPLLSSRSLFLQQSLSLYQNIPIHLLGSLKATVSIFKYKPGILSTCLLFVDFFNEFDFWDSGNVSDPTADSTYPTAAYYMPKEAAQNQSLAYVTDQGNFRLGVDSTFTYHGLDLRPSVRITSHKTIQQGLIIIDAAHVAYALTAWPSIWLTDVSQPWPTAGEIDIYESVGLSHQNTMSYHTSSGCFYDANATQTGILSTVSLDCNALSNGDQACGSADPNTNSFGEGANTGGGSVYALEWTDSAMKMWHFNRVGVPADITKGKPNPSVWGPPVANLASTYCELNSYFGPQSLIMNIDLCGTWAGSVYPGGPQACFKYAQANPEAFKDAYFEIASVKFYQ
ncbi:glycoside hydrolase family 16 protein [Sphaerobolus stellatus SS14]|uniref:Glycoside hydrolase family 16 protein n=1 Tax=Sphaerobolus stellatus (strain SS14) TaxID=990650 RepID=A0A0C9T8N7_SPHS4|nr:glycoside hydrolase family 16 protein [Sphaerobolus stellatus SS14]